MAESWRPALNAAAVAELFWRPGSGSPQAGVVTPLIWEDLPTVAFTYADAAVARSVAGAARVAVSLTDRRLSGEAWRPMVMTGRPELVEDPRGVVFSGPLLPQELRKHPPSRTLADSMLLRREHWWFVPRLLLRLRDVRVTPSTARAPADAVLARFGDGVTVCPVRIARSSGRRHDLLPSHGPPPAPGEAVLLRHDFSEPDRERDCRWTATGRWDGTALTAEAQYGDTTLPGPLSLPARIRRQYRLSRDCRRQLAAVEV
ncbi:hypothetical protein LX16_5320 [Stackebrandtia albiflava]|uniref:Uncharacterized protein n=1 Tax=Stackebrandtia albiflava TaxID=406432 RepID=A0A562UL79_9ACTN|nr:pyridoxamine 5'-phosphate oxidase family protein [Stackebrandtia albiflava]TWJ06356.1 hypothetical protein LX16_5320 [Stackebrandtia albiflava]